MLQVENFKYLIIYRCTRCSSSAPSFLPLLYQLSLNLSSPGNLGRFFFFFFFFFSFLFFFSLLSFLFFCFLSYFFFLYFFSFLLFSLLFFSFLRMVSVILSFPCHCFIVFLSIILSYSTCSSKLLTPSCFLDLFNLFRHIHPVTLRVAFLCVGSVAFISFSHFGRQNDKRKKLLVTLFDS
jgi:hypothetical protein